MSTNFNNTGRLMRDGDPITEFETDARTYPRHVGKLYVEGNWFDVDQARELRDFLNTILPAEVCERCKGHRFVTIHFPGNDTQGAWDADDQPCPECNADGDSRDAP